MQRSEKAAPRQPDRRHFVGGSDARTIMGKDEKALKQLWQEKRGEVSPSGEGRLVGLVQLLRNSPYGQP